MSFVPVLFENGHVFAPAPALGLNRDWTVCSLCGIIRRRDGENKPCRGRVRVNAR
jgi:hypothetical protein